MNEPKKTELKMTSIPKMMGSLVYTNQFLKSFSAIAMILTCMMSIALLKLMTDEPLVIALNPDGKTIERTALPKAEDQVKEGVKHYLEKRYHWEPGNVIKKLKESEEFISPQALKAFQGSIGNVAKFSTEKTVSQKVYADKIEVNLLKGTAFVTGDRITSIQGFKTAGNLRLELTFETGKRTLNNPWGLYILKEREE